MSSSGARGGPALTAAMGLCLAVGLGLLLYPAVSSYVNETSLADAVTRYEGSVQAFGDEDREALLAAAHAYNDSLRGDPVHDPFIEGSGTAVPDNYYEVLDVDGTGVMGTVSIPAIGVELPIYHGTADEVLQKGAGHIPQTSFPVGGAGTHAVITGHTGLPDKMMFTNLVRVGEGDVFVIEVVGERRAYRVDDVRVVEPADVGAIAIDRDREYVTLLTCTPYGINSHRLLVRGAPCEMPSDGDLAAEGRPMPWTALFALTGLLAAGCVAFAAAGRARRRAAQVLREGAGHGRRG